MIGREQLCIGGKAVHEIKMGGFTQQLLAVVLTVDAYQQFTHLPQCGKCNGAGIDAADTASLCGKFALEDDGVIELDYIVEIRGAQAERTKFKLELL